MVQASSLSGRSLGLALLVAVLVGCGSTVSPPAATLATPGATSGANPGASSAPPTVPSPSAVAPTPKPTSPPPTGTPAPATEPGPTASLGPVEREQLGARAIAFFDRTHGIVVGAGGPAQTRGVIRRTNDGGRTWGRTIALDSGPLVAVAVAGSHRAWAVASCDPEAPAGCVDGVFRSNDGGATWARISSSVVSSLSFVDAEHGWAINGAPGPAGGAPSGLVATTDGGRTWKRLRSSCPARFGGPTAVSFVDRQHGWVGCNYTFGAGGAVKGIVETADGGRHWTVRSGVSTGQGSVGSISWGDYLFALVMRQNGTGMWLGQRGTTARTATSGRHWTDGRPSSFDGGDIPIAVTIASDPTWYVVMWLANAQETALERSDDAGRQWSVVGPIGAP